MVRVLKIGLLAFLFGCSGVKCVKKHCTDYCAGLGKQYTGQQVYSKSLNVTYCACE